MTSITWDDNAIARLRGLWDEGHSTAEIGRRMGITKNAVVGKAHRLELPGRPSPIRGGDPSRPRRPRTKPAPPPLQVAATLALLPSAPAAALAPVSAQVLAMAVPPTPARRLGSQPCCWPIGEPRSPGFRFCDDPAIRGKPYCPEHAGISYLPSQEARIRADATRLDHTRGRLTAFT